MSVNQVEEFYLHIESSEFDIDAVKDICDKAGLDFDIQGDHFVVETFYSEDDAISFEFMLNNEL